MKQYLSAQPKSSSGPLLGRSLVPLRSQLQLKREEGRERSPAMDQERPENAQPGHSFANLALTSSGTARLHELPPTWIQPKLTIGAPGDRYEQEADRVAKQVVQRLHAPQVEQPQMNPTLQRKPKPEDEEKLQRKPIQMRAGAIGGGEASPDLSVAINQARSSGQPLDQGLQQSLGQAMGANFSGVRVHTDAQSDQLNRSIQAKAFTTGRDVFFRQGVYQPGSRGGQELIAHELTHVVQQNGGAVRRSPLQQEPLSQPQTNQAQSAMVGEDRVMHDIVIQRKSLTQSGLAAGLTPAGETRKTVGAASDGGGLDGIVYDGAAIAKQDDKVSAIHQAAVAAGNIGQRVDDWGRKDKIGGGKPWTPPRMFTRAPGPFNDSTVATLDPFFHRITVPYTVGEVDQTLQFVYQHGSAFQGYVAQVMDTGSTAVSTAANMYHGKSNKKETTNPYSDQHAPTESRNILAMTGGTGEESIDAYTKLAGEGARWECVRDNASKLSNDSYFYCQDPKAKGSVLTVRFDELWVSWASHFKKKYNIKNAEVINQIKNNLGRSAPKKDMGPRDVNLEAEA